MRVFAGLPLPPEKITELKKTVDFISAGSRYLRAVKPAGLHITLFFFGELRQEKVDGLIRTMDDGVLKGKKIAARFGEIGQFPEKGNPRVIYIGIGEGSGEITSYYETYCRFIGNAGFGSRDKYKEFVPHITLARNKGGRLDEEFLFSIPRPGDGFIIDRCVLYQSVLSSAGAEYMPLKTILFG
ncbi:MAG: RNA 2',3'-cyclic phosphodiesterase [Spirochaetales bacterium]|nr:RNA 2',3'-cyclic phosphodiesterase [Spirochaetales bacterium]